MVKKSKGRQKIEMVKMKNESNLQVTFSKRRSGLFKKASELCTLCGAEIAIITFSPGRKVFSFGHPNVETVIDRFLNHNHSHASYEYSRMQLSDVHRNANVRELNDHLTEVLSQLESEKKKNEELKKIREDSKMPENWWEQPIEGLDINQAKEFKANLEKLKKLVTLEASKFFQTNVPHQQNFYVGSSSNAPFGVDASNANINPADLNQLHQRRMMNMNAFYNPNLALTFGNNSHGDIPEGYVPEYTMNYRPEYNQNQNQRQNMSLKQEDMSEYEHYHHHRPDHSRF